MKSGYIVHGQIKKYSKCNNVFEKTSTMSIKDTFFETRGEIPRLES